MILCELITVVIAYSYSLFNDTSAVIGHHNNILVNCITVNIIIRWRTICYRVIGYLISISRPVIFAFPSILTLYEGLSFSRDYYKLGFYDLQFGITVTVCLWSLYTR